MKNIFIACVLFAVASATASAQQKSNLDFLRKYNDKSAFDVNLLSDATMKPRLQKLLGAEEYAYLVKKIWQVASPVKVEKNFVYAWGMQENSGGDPSATILADINRNILYVGIVKENQTKIYAEDGSGAVPKELEDWTKKQSSN